MLESFAAEPFASWDVDTVGRLIAVQRACLGFRKQRLDLAVDVGAEARALLDEAANGRLLSRWTSASTVHTSAVDENGIGCSITASSGYGSGEMPPGTGLWLNNCLGELELNRRGLDAGPIGARLPSNMAPSVACREGRVLAVGSPGADRITTAMHQFLVNALQADMHLEEAVAIPRLHIDTSGDEVSLAVEEGIALPDDLGLALRRFDGINMYFGGVGAVAYDRETGFEIAADPRREGATCLYDGRSAR
jgi:gamma-glutamyltranspeptidase/glutathione hydrolase